MNEQIPPTVENPQMENGFTPIANEIMDALARTKFNSRESRIVFAILRKTYGYQKKEDWIANKQLEKITGIHRFHCSNTVSRLISRKIVTKTGNKIKFNKLYSQWKDIPKLVTTKMLPKLVVALPKLVTTIENTTKENIPPTPPEGGMDDLPVSSPGSKAEHTNRRALGTNPRALGTNPRAKKKTKEKKPDEPFTEEQSDAYIQNMVSQPQNKQNLNMPLYLIGRYFQCRDKVFASKQCAQMAIREKNNQKIAELIVKNYNTEEIKEAMVYFSSDKFWRDRWTLRHLLDYLSNPK